MNYYGGAAKGTYRGIMAVGSLGVANGFGLYDMPGNVEEWCEDLMYENYVGAPGDGRAREDGLFTKYTEERGCASNTLGEHCRSAFRQGVAYSYSMSILGFRIAASSRP